MPSSANRRRPKRPAAAAPAKPAPRRAASGLPAWLLRHVELRLAALLLFAALAALIFLAVADAVSEGETAVADHAILLALRNPADLADPLGPAWLEEMGRDATALGGTALLTFFTLAAAGFLWLERRPATMLFLLGAVVGGITLSTLAKQFFDRPRPDIVPHLAYVHTPSFPSGHSMMSAVTYLTLAAILARGAERPAIRIYVMGLAILTTLAVGVSRVYLGVHWPSDVLAGWAAGAAWALSCAALAEFLATRGRIEPETTKHRVPRQTG